jgi:hypothetical protein
VGDVQDHYCSSTYLVHVKLPLTAGDLPCRAGGPGRGWWSLPGGKRPPGVCCIERSQVILTGRFAVNTPVRRTAGHDGKPHQPAVRHPERLPPVRSPVKIGSDRSMQQTRLPVLAPRPWPTRSARRR